MSENYQIMLDDKIKSLKDSYYTPTLFLHACCAPCSSYVLEYLSEYFNIIVFYYNPNISPLSEWQKRCLELEKLIKKMPLKNKVTFVSGDYDNDKFIELSEGLEDLSEGGERCFKCYRLRLRETAKYAKQYGADFFTTTLSISPHKNAQVLNNTGAEISSEFGIPYLYSDFKKKNGYKRSCELSVKYDLYRQDYCGCIYSKIESLKRKTL